MALQKAGYSQTTLSDLSLQALERIEQLSAFQNADSFAIYHGMPDEVQTASFIEKWAARKTIYLPVICGDVIRLHQYKDSDALKPGVFGILEPATDALSEKARPDLVIVPGVAFDRDLNRLGRGKGYYDKLLSEPEMRYVIRIGIGFSFQVVREVPTSPVDIRMHRIVTDKEVLIGD